MSAMQASSGGWKHMTDSGAGVVFAQVCAHDGVSVSLHPPACAHSTYLHYLVSYHTSLKNAMDVDPDDWPGSTLR